MSSGQKDQSKRKHNHLLSCTYRVEFWRGGSRHRSEEIKKESTDVEGQRDKQGGGGDGVETEACSLIGNSGSGHINNLHDKSYPVILTMYPVIRGMHTYSSFLSMPSTVVAATSSGDKNFSNLPHTAHAIIIPFIVMEIIFLKAWNPNFKTGGIRNSWVWPKVLFQWKGFSFLIYFIAVSCTVFLFHTHTQTTMTTTTTTTLQDNSNKTGLQTSKTCHFFFLVVHLFLLDFYFSLTNPPPPTHPPHPHQQQNSRHNKLISVWG